MTADPQQKLVARACWCGSGVAQFIGCFNLTEGQRFPLVQCTGCGVQAIHPQPDDATLARYYSPEYYGSSRRKFI